MLTESQIYVRLRDFLPTHGWNILGGQPPGGTGDIPIIEVKDDSYKGKGSKGSKRIDLIAYKHPRFLLLELKPEFSESDLQKLRTIVNSPRWRRSFVSALDERGVWPADAKREEVIDSAEFLLEGLGYNAGGLPAPPDVIVFLLSPNSIEVMPGVKAGIF